MQMKNQKMKKSVSEDEGEELPKQYLQQLLVLAICNWLFFFSSPDRVTEFSCINNNKGHLWYPIFLGLRYPSKPKSCILMFLTLNI